MRYYFLVIIFLTKFVAQGQEYVLDSLLPNYGDLIHMDSNVLLGADNSPNFNHFFSKLDSVYSGKKEKLHIFHIGGSHIQADIYSNKLRTYFQNMNEVSMGQRGFVFPFQLAHTNNPSNYSIKATKDKWKGYRNSVCETVLLGVWQVFRQHLKITQILFI